MSGSGDLLSEVRSKAQLVLQHAQHVRLANAETMRRVADELRPALLQHKTQADALPLHFAHDRHRVNFHSVQCLLEIGRQAKKNVVLVPFVLRPHASPPFCSGFRVPLHAALQRGAHETMTAGTISLFLTHGDLSAEFLSRLTLSDVAENFALPLSVEVPVQRKDGAIDCSALTELKPSPLRPLAEQVLKVLNDVGNELLRRRCSDFFQLFVQELKGDERSSARCVALLASLPGFDDFATYSYKEKENDAVKVRVPILKKAQLLCATLARNSPPLDSALFGFKETYRLTAFADNVLPCVLHAAGALVFSDELLQVIERGDAIASGSVMEVELRCGAIAATEELSAILECSADALDFAVWKLGKDARFRNIKRHVTMDSLFY